MSKTPRRPAADVFRAAAFRDQARGIVWKDRAERKVGRSVDTGGAISRALEQAYRLGFEEAQTGQPVRAEAPAGAPMTWELVPRRPRKVLWSICLAILSDGGRPEIAGTLSRTKLETGGPGWCLAVTDGSGALDDVYADRDVAVLVRHDLLGPAPGRLDRVELTARGRATWWAAIEAAGSLYAIPL